MPFFARQKTDWPPVQHSFHREQTIDDDGNVTFKKVSDNSVLPDVALFDLKHQLKAGVSVQQVSTKILGDGVAVAQAIETFNKQTNKGGSNE